MTKARDIASAIPAPSTVSSAELGYLDGVTSAIQTQIDTKAPSSTAVTLTGTQTLTNKTLTNPVIASVINNTLTSTTGDIIYASAANTPARLGIGSSAQVLTVASGIPSWATPSGGSSGITKILATTFSAVSSYSAPAATFSATYNQYLILFEITSQSASVDIQMRLRTGGSDETSSNYTSQTIAGTTSASASQTNTTFWNLGGSSTNTRFAYRGDFFNPFGTGQHLHLSQVFRLNSSSTFVAEVNEGRLDTGTSYDAFTLFPASGTITGRIAVYGYSL